MPGSPLSTLPSYDKNVRGAGPTSCSVFKNTPIGAKLIASWSQIFI